MPRQFAYLSPSPVPDEETLDPRKAAILEAVVTAYVSNAQPVGSHHVADSPGLEVSSATVRSEMVALEREGYLTQPHTSAGRIPTDKGYRFFVDHLAGPGILGVAQRQKVARFFDHVHGEVEGMLERTSGLLSELTSYASVVVGPGHELAAIRSIQLVGLGTRSVLLVAVLSDGAVEKRTLDLGDEPPEAVLVSAGARLQAAWQGRALSEVRRLDPVGDPELDRVVEAASDALADLARPGDPDQVFVGGPSRLAGAFDALETVRSVLGILEQQLVVVTLLRGILDRGLSVAIGTEHGFEPLASCAVVVAPVPVEGYESGAVGLLGPTRMDYPQALAAAHVVGERLGEHLGVTLGPVTIDTPQSTHVGSVERRSGAQRGTKVKAEGSQKKLRAKAENRSRGEH